jgi:hypothetical protein
MKAPTHEYKRHVKIPLPANDLAQSQGSDAVDQPK